MKPQQPPDAIPQTALYPMFRGERVIEFVEKEVPEPEAGQLLIRCQAKMNRINAKQILVVCDRHRFFP